MAKKKPYKWTKAQKAAASLRAKERYAAKRAAATTETRPLKLGGLMQRLELLASDAQNLASNIEALKTAIESL